MPGGYVVRDANGQAIAYLYSRENEAGARQAKVLALITLTEPGPVKLVLKCTCHCMRHLTV